MNLEYSEYEWITYERAKKEGKYILPKGQEVEVIFQDNTSVHIITFMKLLSKDVNYLISLFNIPENESYPKLLTVSVYKDGYREEITLDTNYVADAVGEPIFCNEVAEKCMWPSFIIKALAKYFGSYAELENASLEGLLRIVYGPSILESQLNPQTIEDNPLLENSLRRNMPNQISSLFQASH